MSEENKPVVVIGNVNYKASDGNYMELGFVMPLEVVKKLTIQFIDWENRWQGTASDFREYFFAEKDFLEKNKKDQSSS